MHLPADGCLTLHCHPATPALGLRAVGARVAFAGDTLHIAFRLAGELSRLRVPAAATPARTDELWRHTCGEAFVAAAGDPAYREFNFSPSGAWAAYAFAGYREPLRPPGGPAPAIACHADGDELVLEVALATAWLPAGDECELALTLVAEESGDDGAPQLSYWALRHTAGRPDFHRRDSFAARLPALP
ncbi:DOMON-like domain-containing protein [Azospira restricta]|uniref:DOMON-like domain-containing protein n=1 Tax=Azospira restricta TaxID=404405 RepID=A0A974SQ66_9RHOO|nr:DOMON-like domain-containing protein [Azospira restricta]QRJ64412.1 DOMON-like domain-containing protein [Azospira restricta]